MSKIILASLVVSASLSVSASASASETSPLRPYIPTTLFIPGSSPGSSPGPGGSTNSSTAYIFIPNDDDDDDDNNNVNFLSVDLTSTIASSSVSDAVTTLTSGLPFLSSGTNTTTFHPTLAADGSIVVYAGDCTPESTSGVWIYNTSSSSQPSWTQHQVSSSSAATPGPYFLGGGVAFSEVIAPTLSTPQIYSYGGQCPNASVDGTTWVEAAEYSNAMVKLTPSAGGYEAASVWIKSPPIAEAGFSMTPMRPSTSNISGTVSQGVNSVVLGGHTQLAFVNMSTAAVWSLPEESWTFVSISGPSASSAADAGELAKNRGEQVQVQSRSGHTAVLNEAGTALVVVGGWVGNTSQAAEPQVVVLEMDNSDFGQWSWSVPGDQPLTGGEGIYGHGAALLPGDVMMVVGGYSISPSSSSSSSSRLGKRGDVSVAGGQLNMFLNLTSMSWEDSYTNPSTASSGSSGDKPASPNFTALGLGLGIGLGIPTLLALAALVIFCIRRSRRNRHAVRDQHVRDLNAGAAFISPSEMFEAEHEHYYPWGPQGARWYSYAGGGGGDDSYGRGEKSLGYENLRGQQRGAPQDDFDDPSPVELPGAPRGSGRRKPAPRVAKGLYHPTGVDESRALGVISPILEDEEDELSMHGAISPDREVEGNEDDPFVTPSDILPPTPTRTIGPGPDEHGAMLYAAPSPSSGPPSPTDERTPTRATPHIVPQHPEVQDWVSDADASDALITRRLQPHSSTSRRRRSVGRISPTRRGSVRAAEGEMSPGARTDSNLSESNRSAFSFLPNRADSLRTAAAAASAALAERRGGTSHSDQSSSSNTNSSYTTAKSIPALRQEGPGLLRLGRPRAISDIEDMVDAADDDYPFASSPGSPGKGRQPPRRSWFGSLRRVFSGGHSTSGSGSSNAGDSHRTASPAHGDGGGGDYDRFGLGSLGLGGVGLLQKRRRQGRSAWDGTGGASGYRRHDFGDGDGEGWDDADDWDIERAVEQRLVQVMFSVPKERLRVVNGEPDIISIGESVVVVDPEKEEEAQAEEDPLSSSILLKEDERLLGKGKGRMESRQTSAEHELLQTYNVDEQRRPEIGGHVEAAVEASDEGEKPERRRPLLLEVPRGQSSSEASEAPGRRSFSPGIPMRAEEVRFEKPRTRVLAMVEGIEERSRSNSPTKDRLKRQGSDI